MYLIEELRKIKLHQFQLEALEKMKNIIEGIIHLPTGVGKSIIFTAHILEEMAKSPKVVVICTPRIILTNQMVEEFKDTKDIRICVVHSGQKIKSKKNNVLSMAEYYDGDSVDYNSDIRPTTSFSDVEKEYKLAKNNGQSLIIFSTYHSANIFANKLDVDVLYCDESHHLVTKEFCWIADEKANSETSGVKGQPSFFDARKKYYFTATLKHTTSDKGLGLNNKTKFGDTIISKTPQDAINEGLITSALIHYAEIENAGTLSKNEDKDGHMILESFKHHENVITEKQNVMAPKMLVVCSDTKSLNNAAKYILKHKSDDIKLMTITSKDGAIINGEKTTRENFLNELANLKDDDKVIILHVKILTEGIDVTGITGVLYLHLPDSIASFFQNLGRGTRLHKTDRENLKNGIIKPLEFDKFIKPYVYVIIPIISQLDFDKEEKIVQIIKNMRIGGHVIDDNIVITNIKGDEIVNLENILGDETISNLNIKKLHDTVNHDVEEELDSIQETNELIEYEEQKNKLIKSGNTGLFLEQFGK